jgi:hypothetical protein
VASTAVSLTGDPVNPQPMPFFMQAAADDDDIFYDAADFRRYSGAVFARGGIIGHHSLLLTQTPTVGWSITVHQGYAYVGGYLVQLVDDVTVDFAGVTTNPAEPRTHKVWLAVYDKLAGNTETSAKILVQEDPGTGAPAPTGTTVSMQLGHVTISPGQTSILNTHINTTYQHASAYDDPVVIDPAGDMVDGSAAMGTAPLSAREGHGIVRLSGAVSRSGTNLFQPGVMYTVGTLTSTMRPTYSRWATAACTINKVGTDTGTYTCRVNITTGGEINVYTPTGNEFEWVLLDGVTFELD